MNNMFDKIARYAKFPFMLIVDMTIMFSVASCIMRFLILNSLNEKAALVISFICAFGVHHYMNVRHNMRRRNLK